jgi:hypothetical protein
MILPIVFFAEYWLKLCEDCNSEREKKFIIKRLGIEKL